MKKILFAILIIFTTSSSQHVDCIGGSITRNGYPGYANNLMEENGYAWRIHNYGVPGASVVANNPYSEKDEYDEVVCREAQVVVILLGANDWKWYFEDTDGSRKIRWRNDYVKLVQEFKKNSVVILGTLTYRISVNGDVTDANNTMDAMTVVVRSIAAEYGLGVIDFQTALGFNPENFWPSDGLHPSDLGSELLGIAAYEYLKTLVPIGRKVKNCDPEVTIEKMDFDWVQIEDKIHFTWDSIDGATHYKLSKYWVVNGIEYYWMDDTITETEYYDTDFIYYLNYYCKVKAYKHSDIIGESNKITVHRYEYLGIDDEYWEAVEDYENQKPSLFNGCSF